MPGVTMSCHAYALVTVFLWSSAYVFTKVALSHFSVSALGLLRCGIAAAVLLLYLFAWRTGLPRLRDWPWFFLSGATGFALYLLFFNQGMRSLGPTESCIIISTSPIITAALARAAFREKLTLAGWAAIGGAFGGILLMTLWNSSMRLSWGIIWMLLAAVSISAYNCIQRYLSDRYAPVYITACSFACGVIPLLYLLPETALQVSAAPVSQIALVVYLGIFPSALAYLCWAKALAKAEKTSMVANYMFLTPLLALLLEYLVLGRWPGAGTFVGGTVILCSLALFVSSSKKKA